MNADPAGGPAPFSAEHFANGWVLLRHVPLGDSAIDIVLIQPTAGVALLEVDPRWTPDALDRFRARLRETGFLAAYPGHLPMIHRRLEPAHVGQLGEILSEAFIWQDPLSVFGPGAWHEALERALAPGFSGEPVAPPADASTMLAAAAAILAAERAAEAQEARDAAPEPAGSVMETQAGIAAAPDEPALPDAVPVLPAPEPEPAAWAAHAEPVAPSEAGWQPAETPLAQPVVAPSAPEAIAGEPPREAAPHEPAPAPAPEATDALPARLPPPRPIRALPPEPVVATPLAPQPRQPATMAPTPRLPARRESGSSYVGMIAAALAVAAIGGGLLYLEHLHRTGVERPVTNFLSPPDPPPAGAAR